VNYPPWLSNVGESGFAGPSPSCVVVSPRPYDTDSVGWTVASMLKLIRKKLRSGTGDILDAVIAGKDGGLAKQKKTRMPTSRNV
jgi:hypothetical protein